MEKIRSKISVVVSIYNVENYVDKCIYSLRNQTYKNIEIVLVVRDSGDKCAEICKAHEAADDRIKIVHQTGRGLVNARKEGTLSASGEYIIHMDGDDWLDDDWLDNVAVYLKDHNPDMIYLLGLVQEGKNKEARTENIQKFFFEDEEICSEIFPMFMDPEKCFKGTIRWNVWSWIVKRDLLLQQQMLIDDSVYLIEDAVYVFLCILKAKSVVFIDNGKYHYVRRSDSGMSTLIGIKKGNLEKAYNILNDNFQHCDTSYDLDKFLNIFIRSVIISWEYKSFQSQFTDYLYPYTKVKAGSKVIVYGAGRFGRQVVDAVLDSKIYSLAGWTDRNTAQKPCRGRKIQLIQEVLKENYDNIVIAILNSDIAQEVRDNLLQMGVSDNRIALMDVRKITEGKLPW